MTLTSSPPSQAEGRSGSTEEPEALFREARARRTQRWIGGTVLATAVLIATVGLLVSRPVGSTAHGRLAQGEETPSPALPAPSSVARAAWVDYNGDLHIGQLKAGSQRIVTDAGASPTTPLVALGGDIFWVRIGTAPSPANTKPTVEELDVSSGVVKRVAQGQMIFPSIDSKDLFIVRSGRTLVEMPVRSAGPRRTFAIPSGWYLNAGNGLSNPIAVVDGIMVQSSQGQTGKTPPTVAIWNPGTGAIDRLGPDEGLIGAFTPPGAHYSLLAWVPGSCETNPFCSLLVTNTATRTSVRIRSPLPYGFDVGGAFSPNGEQLALFIKTNAGLYDPATQLAVANTRSGQLRRVPAAAGEIGESVGWVRWIGDSDTLIAGTFSTNYTRYNHYLVNSRTLGSSLLDFSDNRDVDINFSTVVLP
jgi:hypothetical protein